jgi:polyketide biosynthesis acyl carrier protein
VSNAETIFNVIKSKALVVVPELDPDAVSMDRTLAELGCNSIDRADIVTMAMEELGVVVPVTEFHQSQEIGELVRLFGDRT